ncbi:concanavalin A-like lectin/glucanase [Westerdykella ornata]|uniref:Concanavalin A-like lectin/glucanase n=1 Tax=Westerdykella ornata TaxID=318751 RepID=A0A6A6JE40_WESOR|nr:concanavalin A-like lectin/glucanase [Westerdykella ornata]KAF2274535.1 concanavalin A-like lectin/glucanase [Westerdykella ornata]
MVFSISYILPLSLSLLLHSHPALSAYTSTTDNSDVHDPSKSCSCYVISSDSSSPSSSSSTTTPTYFLHHRFFDFRNLADGQPGKYVSDPPLLNSTQDNGTESVWSPDVLDTDAWTTDWAIQNWSKPSSDKFPVRMVNSPANIYISQDPSNVSDASTWLTLRTSRLDDFQSAAEMESTQKNVLFASLRMYARVRGDRGAVAGFFSFYNDTNESDVEILTRDPRDRIRYTNQPAVDDEGDEVPGASVAVSGLGSWTEWAEHRIDWVEGRSFWFRDGRKVAENTYSVPSVPSYLVLNMWGDGGEWSGEMEVGGSAVLEVRWIEMVFNTSGPVEGVDGGDDGSRRRKRGEGGGKDGCKVVCKVDGVKTAGSPEVVSWAVKATVSWWVGVGVGLGWFALALGF